MIQSGVIQCDSGGHATLSFCSSKLKVHNLHLSEDFAPSLSVSVSLAVL